MTEKIIKPQRLKESEPKILTYRPTTIRAHQGGGFLSAGLDKIVSTRLAPAVSKQFEARNRKHM